MSAAGRYASDNSQNDPVAFGPLNRDAHRPAEERNRLLLAQIADHAAGLRAGAQLLGDRIEQLGRLVANRRAN